MEGLTVFVVVVAFVFFLGITGTFMWLIFSKWILDDISLDPLDPLSGFPDFWKR